MIYSLYIECFYLPKYVCSILSLHLYLFSPLLLLVLDCTFIIVIIIIPLSYHVLEGEMGYHNALMWVYSNLCVCVCVCVSKFGKKPTVVITCFHHVHCTTLPPTYSSTMAQQCKHMAVLT